MLLPFLLPLLALACDAPQTDPPPAPVTLVPTLEAAEPNTLLPAPAALLWGEGQLPLAGLRLELSQGDARTERAVVRARALLGERGAGEPAADGVLITVGCNDSAETPLLEADERYHLDLSDDGGELLAEDCRGVLHGLATLQQLVIDGEAGPALPAVRIEDQPRFPWRGLLIDPARHFLPIPELERSVELMAAVKLNTLHLHLSDDQGFRLRSERWPLLYERASDGLVYSKEEIEGLVAFAADRGVRVMPELDVPGHATALLTAYPELAALPDAYRIERRFGIFNAALDPTREKVYAFLDTLLGELTPWFPDRYWHLGGDEVSGVHWERSPRIRAVMEKSGLDTSGLQARFVGRVIGMLAARGKTAVGWDEVLDPTLPEGTVVQVYREQSQAAEPVDAGFPTLVSKGFYLDHNLPALTHHAIDPSEGLSPAQAAQVLGGEACLWGEFVDADTLDWRAWPRAAAVADRLWAPQDTDSEDLYARLALVEAQLERQGSRHRTGRVERIRVLSGEADPAPVALLVELVAPATYYSRHNARPHGGYFLSRVHQGYTSETPLTRFVDVTTPDSARVRDFEAAIDAGDEAALRDMLQSWVDNDAAFRLTSAEAPMLWEVEALSAQVSGLAALGLAALNGEEVDPDELERLSEPGPELILLIAPGVKALVAERQAGG